MTACFLFKLVFSDHLLKTYFDFLNYMAILPLYHFCELSPLPTPLANTIFDIKFNESDKNIKLERLKLHKFAQCEKQLSLREIICRKYQATRENLSQVLLSSRKTATYHLRELYLQWTTNLQEIYEKFISSYKKLSCSCNKLISSCKRLTCSYEKLISSCKKIEKFDFQL